MPSTAHLTVSLIPCGSLSSARDKGRDLEGRRASSKSPPRVPDSDEREAGRNGRDLYIPGHGVIYLPSRQINIFISKRKKKKMSYIVFRPGRDLPAPFTGTSMTVFKEAVVSGCGRQGGRVDSNQVQTHSRLVGVVFA